MSRQVLSRPGDPLWLVDERVRHLEQRVGRLATALAQLAPQRHMHQDRFLDRHPMTATTHVVDVNCADGAFTEHLADLVPAGQVLGIEADEARLCAAGQRRRPNLRFRLGQPHELYLVVPAGSVDLVVSRITDSPPPTDDPRFYTAARTILQPGGWLHVEAESVGSAREIHQMLDGLAEDWRLPAPRPLPDAASTYDLVRLAGFDVPDEGVLTVAYRREFSRGQFLDYLRSRALPRYLVGADDDLRQEFWQSMVGRLDEVIGHEETYDQTLVRLDVLARRPGGPPEAPETMPRYWP